MTITTDPILDPTELDTAIGAFAERIALAAIGSFELATIELGMRLGLYAALAMAPATASEFASRAGIDGRYAIEWLEQQATAGIVSFDGDRSSPGADGPIFTLPEAQRACLLDPDSLASVAPLATFAVAASGILPELVEAFRNGTGISFAGYGEWIRRAQENANRPQFSNLLASEWFPAMPDVVTRLALGGRVADVGCGCGWSAIAIARGYPLVTVDGFDTDSASIADARVNAVEAGLSDRVTFHATEAQATEVGYDLVCCFEALHDMAHPIEALAAMRSMTNDGGAVFIVDERAADGLTPNDPDPMQRLFYAASVLHCLPVGRSEPDSAATGTLLRIATLEAYADQAGFASVEVLPIQHDMFRFYRLHG